MILSSVIVVTLMAACGGTSDDTTASPSAATPTAGASAGKPAGSQSPVSSTDALYFYPPVEGATLTYANGGAVSGTSKVTVAAVTSDADGQTVTVDELVSGADNPVSVKRSFRTAADGGLSIDAEAFGASAPGFRATSAGDDIVIPPIAELETGASTTGQTFVEFSGSGVTGRNDVAYTVRGSGFTSVTVPAGTARTYLVILELDMDSSFAGSTRGTMRYWLLPGFGLVRQEAVTAGQTSTSELTATSVPL